MVPVLISGALAPGGIGFTLTAHAPIFTEIGSATSLRAIPMAARHTCDKAFSVVHTRSITKHNKTTKQN